jgi:hypothetical protein
VEKSIGNCQRPEITTHDSGPTGGYVILYTFWLDLATRRLAKVVSQKQPFYVVA